MKHIFVVDDEAEIRTLVIKYLEKEGYKTTSFSSGTHVAVEVERLKPDLIVMDIMMPEIDGLDVCKEIRKKSEVPIIFVSARGEEIDRIIGLELGADDYLAKPFSPRELLVRIKNIFKRLDKNHSNKIEDSILIGNSQIIQKQRRVLVNGAPLNLTTKEYDTLIYLAINVNIPLRREQLLKNVWGYDYFGEIRVVDDVIKRIRKKMKDLESSIVIVTVWGFGYKIEDKTE